MFSACVPPSDIQVTNTVTRFVNSFHLKSLAKSADAVYCVTLIIINSIYEGGIHLEIFRISFHTLRCESDAGSNHFTCKSQTRGTILRVPFKTLIEVLPACLDSHLRKWGSLSRILRTTYIDL